MNITEIFPLKVVYPYGGEHFLLEWNTHREGTHVAISRTEKGIDAVFNNVISIDHKVRLNRCLLVDIVAPDESMKLAYAKSAMSADMIEFIESIGSAVLSSVKHGLPLPRGVKPCLKKQPNDDAFHSDCMSCGGKRFLMGCTTEELYTKNIHKIDRSGRFVKDSERLEKFSLAKTRDASRNTYVVQRSFGDHSRGVIIYKYNDIDNESLSNVNFLYHELRCIGTGKFDEIVDDLANKKKLAYDDWWANKQKKNAEAEIASALDGNRKLFSYFSGK